MLSRHTNDNPADAYARDVVAGRVPAGKYHRLSCARHLKDRARENTPGFPYRFVWEARDREGKLTNQCAAHFFAVACRMKHFKGRQFVGKNFEPTPCQHFRLGSVFGWRHVDTGLRRFTTSYNEVPRKQGKSFEEAIVAVYVTFFEGEAGAEGYCIATKEDQAKISFGSAQRLVKQSGLSQRIQVNAKSLYRESSDCKLQPLGSDSDTLDGLNPHFVGVDELHKFKVRGLLDVMESATGSRLNPFFFIITTAGDDLVSVCGDQHDYACKILDGVLEDDESTVSFFAFIAHADEKDDWLDEKTWIKANPHWGVSVNPDDMRKLAAKAKNMPAAVNEFKQKRLNMWVNTTAPCLSMDGWKKGQTDWTWRDMRGEQCYVGIDLAAKIDLMSMSFLFPPNELRLSWRVLNYLWTPEETLRDRELRDRAPYSVWVDQGWLIAHPGPKMTSSVVKDTLVKHRSDFDIIHVGMDEWHAERLVDELKEVGFPEDKISFVRQNPSGLAVAEVRFQAEVLAGNVDARGCPVTAWAASNVVNKPQEGNVFFTKDPKKIRGRIDPIKSATIAMSVALRIPLPKPVTQLAEWYA